MALDLPVDPSDIPIDPELLDSTPTDHGAFTHQLHDTRDQHHLVSPNPHTQYSYSPAEHADVAFPSSSYYDTDPQRMSASPTSQSIVTPLPLDNSIHLAIPHPTLPQDSSRKRSRSSKSQSAAASPRLTSSMLHRAKGSGKGKGSIRAGSAGSKNRAVTRDQYCSFCAGTDERNKTGVPERMTSCHRCGRSGHPSCLQLSHLADRISSYDWHCIECKTCEICKVKGDDVSVTRSARN